jgi:hypothetical protein
MYLLIVRMQEYLAECLMGELGLTPRDPPPLTTRSPLRLNTSAAPGPPIAGHRQVCHRSSRRRPSAGLPPLPPLPAIGSSAAAPPIVGHQQVHHRSSRRRPSAGPPPLFPLPATGRSAASSYSPSSGHSFLRLQFPPSSHPVSDRRRRPILADERDASTSNHRGAPGFLAGMCVLR